MYLVSVGPMDRSILTKIPKTKRRKCGMNETFINEFEQEFYMTVEKSVKFFNKSLNKRDVLKNINL